MMQRTAKLLPATDDSIREAAAALCAGKLVAFPTETVYGLGGDAFNPRALARIFEAKGRPRFDPLIIHIAALEALGRIADLRALDAASRRRLDRLASALWPGPLSLILPKLPSVPDLATSGLPTVAVRWPAQPAARQLILRSTGAVAAPSANPFGGLSPTRAEHVRDSLGDRIDYILDGGPSAVGLESTVLDLATGAPRILRPGGVSREQIEAIIGPVPAGITGTGPGLQSPGQLPSHYAPATRLEACEREAMLSLPERPGEGWLFFSGASRDTWLGNLAGDKGGAAIDRLWTLSEAGNPAEAAARLFQTLHEMDERGLSCIHAELPPEAGLGAAIRDRLLRAGKRG
ncbi:MAG: threonylcarbamoyl-AMP synthase [Treponema sp.]|jgi:L-threonylcarbamoyladenylate synthase|nr:threonylcarbamoyl-AMP synthase [Treponema sp.]